MRDRKLTVEISILVVLTLLIFGTGLIKNQISKSDPDYYQYFANLGEASAQALLFPGFISSEIGKAVIDPTGTMIIDQRFEIQTCDVKDTGSAYVNKFEVEVTFKERKSFSAFCNSNYVVPITSYKIWLPSDYANQFVTDIQVEGDVEKFNYIKSQNEIRHANGNPLGFIEVFPKEPVESGAWNFQAHYVWHGAAQPILPAFFYPLNFSKISFFFPSQTTEHHTGSHFSVTLPIDYHLYSHRISYTVEGDLSHHIPDFQIDAGNRAYVKNDYVAFENQKEVVTLEGFSGFYLHDLVFAPNFQKIIVIIIAPLLIIVIYGFVLKEFIPKTLVSVLWTGSQLLFRYSVFIAIPTFYMAGTALSQLSYTWYIQEYREFQRSMVPSMLYGLIAGPFLLWFFRRQVFGIWIEKKIRGFWPSSHKAKGDINRADYVQLYLPLFFSVVVAIWLANYHLNRPPTLTLFDLYFLALFTILVGALIYDLRIGRFKR